jgi:hypothetical protein
MFEVGLHRISQVAELVDATVGCPKSETYCI